LGNAFDAVVSGDPAVDRHEVFDRLRTESPTFFSERLGAWVATRYDDVKSVLENREQLVPITEGPGAAVFGGGFFHWRGREHNKKSGVIAKRIRSPRALRDEIGGKVEAIARDAAARLQLDEPIDLREEYSTWVPLLVICELTAIHEAARFRDWYDAIMKGGTSSIGNPAARDGALAAMAELKAFLRPILEERRRNPGDDLVSDLVTATHEGEPWPDEEITSIVGQLLPAGIETTERVLTCTFREMANDHALLRWVRERRDDDDVLAALGAEVLRLYPPIQGVNRVALDALSIGGKEMAKGDRVVAMIVSANRDEDRFARAHAFDAARFAQNPDRQYTAAGDILPFGGGEHHCTGSRLAKTEIVQAVRYLLDRVDRIELLAEAPDVGGLILWAPACLSVRLHAAG
jgi:cytochrome P450